ncbi:response regulator [Pedobacter lithocola]|uniref:Response regulator n=1 Tax=Pedobacter lithocola TaxID=1908239 RepID=A0ABV8P9Z8_9SPHI
MNILVIDDDEIILFIHRTLLENEGINIPVSYFSSAVEALHFLDEHSTNLGKTLLLLDINMPEMNGWQLLAEIESRSYAHLISTVMVTSSVDVQDKKKAQLRYNVANFISKPITDTDIEQLRKSENLSIFFK